MHTERSAATRRQRGRTAVSTETLPDESTWDELWTLYHEAFEPLQELALLNHLFHRADFDELLADERITKLIARSNGQPIGLAMLTNHLDIVPQISPPFLHSRYPEQASRDAVFFGIMVFVADTHRRSTAFARLIAGMGQITADASGVVVFDICQHNLAGLSLDRQLAAIARWFPGSSFAQVDAQQYFAVTLPTSPEQRLPVATLPTGESDRSTDSHTDDRLPDRMPDRIPA